MNMKSKDTSFSTQKSNALLGGSNLPEFGLVSPDSLLNPSQRNSRMNSRNSHSFPSFNDQEEQGQHPLRHFIDNWPKDQSDRASVSWPEELKSDWTQLSMSIPMSSSDFSSSSNSPPQEKPTLSPLRLAREIDPIQMGLSVNNNNLNLGEPNQRQSTWLPVSWGNSVGGPLGEVLNSTSYNVGASKDSSAAAALNLMMDGSSPQMGCSPTGVLQKTTFVSLSNSSSGSSPRTDDKKGSKGAASLCDDLLGSNLANSAPISSVWENWFNKHVKVSCVPNSFFQVFSPLIMVCNFFFFMQRFADLDFSFLGLLPQIVSNVWLSVILHNTFQLYSL